MTNLHDKVLHQRSAHTLTFTLQHILMNTGNYIKELGAEKCGNLMIHTVLHQRVLKSTLWWVNEIWQEALAYTPCAGPEHVSQSCTLAHLRSFLPSAFAAWRQEEGCQRHLGDQNCTRCGLPGDVVPHSEPVTQFKSTHKQNAVA